MKTIRIALLDDHRIVLDGLKLMLSKRPEIEVVLEETNGMVLLEKLQQTQIDILLTDIMMPIIDGFEVTKLVKQFSESIKVIALSMNGEPDLLEKMIYVAKVDGYLLKTSDAKELLLAIENVMEGSSYYAPDLFQELADYQHLKSVEDLVHLTPREIDIVKCIANDLTNKQIAEQLFISERTVETHRKNIFRKAEVHSVIGLIDYARKRKLIP